MESMSCEVGVDDVDVGDGWDIDGSARRHGRRTNVNQIEFDEIIDLLRSVLCFGHEGKED